ncbi:sulfatase [Pseudomonas typographi]|uniref:Sulfatase n=1 Tax=Pseudomonas typographi TaxID=2715964 RepID=A0ABR7Z2F8_9PSED|nr:sulfatase [Pseudomonas typographi]MBD1599573.1 sulfatase [Pseudomonas typographi]
MKAIMVMFDSLNRRMLPPYGCDWVNAPNFTRLAKRSVTFDNCYVGSMPCMPARRELHTGRYNFLHRGWGPLEPFDDSMPQILSEHKVYSHLVSDHQHYWEDGGSTYHSRYDSWEFFRGQEGDKWKGQVAEPAMPPTLKSGAGNPLWRQDWVNRQHMRTEADHPQTKTFDAGLAFMTTNAEADNWFLQIETFDPHEPFYTYDRYLDPYPDTYNGLHFDWPGYQPVSEKPEEVEHIRYRYAALLSMCDRSLGRVMDVMDELSLWQDTLLIVCTDHGYLLDEHGWWAKGVQPWFNEVAHTPLFVWDPRTGVRDERRQALVQMIDLAPTLLEFFGLEPTPDMQGVPLAKRIIADQPARAGNLYGTFGAQVNVTDGRYVYMRGPAVPEQNTPLFEYTLMPMRMRALMELPTLQQASLHPPFPFSKATPTLKLPAHSASRRGAERYGTLLFDLKQDPGQKHPLLDDAIELRMIDMLLNMLRANHAPPEQYERLGLPQQGHADARHLQARAHHDLALQAEKGPDNQIAR